MNNQKQQKPTLTGQRFKTRKRGSAHLSFLPLPPHTHAFLPFFTPDLCPFPADEKERFDPTQFQESIVQGLNQSGTDLEAVAKFLDASGGKLDYRRYAETLFDILVAGGMLGECSSASQRWDTLGLDADVVSPGVLSLPQPRAGRSPTT